MVACIPVTNEKIRAEVSMGGVVVAKTPFVKSFNIQESRSQISATFTVTLEVMGGTSFSLGEELSISAGTKGNLVTRFTGPIESTNVKPSFGKPSYYTITLSGRGVLSVLENKTFSRRMPPNSEGVYCMITSGPDTVNKVKTLDKKVNSGNHTTVASSFNPASSGAGEHSPFIVHVKGGDESASKGGLIGQLASPPSQSIEDSGTGGLNVHDHSDITKGGPAFGVYSAD